MNSGNIDPTNSASVTINTWRGEYSTVTISKGYIKPAQICRVTATISQTSQDPTTNMFSTTSVSVSFVVSVPSAAQAAGATVRAYCGGGARKGRADITRRIFCKCIVGGTAGSVSNRNVPLSIGFLDTQGANANATLGTCVRFYTRSKSLYIQKDCLSAG